MSNHRIHAIRWRLERALPEYHMSAPDPKREFQSVSLTIGQIELMNGIVPDLQYLIGIAEAAEMLLSGPDSEGWTRLAQAIDRRGSAPHVGAE